MVMFEGPCTDCGAVLGDYHNPRCKYAGESRVGISGNMALRRVPEDAPALQRTIEDRLARLRQRIRRDVAQDHPELAGIMLGVLDLLADEL